MSCDQRKMCLIFPVSNLLLLLLLLMTLHTYQMRLSTKKATLQNIKYFRHILAVVHFNENLLREPKQLPDGSIRVSVRYPKFRNGEAIIKDVRVDTTFCKLMLRLLITHL